MPSAEDPRWILLTEDGQYSTLGRHREPTEADISAAEAALGQAGAKGWLAVMSHSIHSRNFPNLIMVRPLQAPASPFDDAVKALRLRSP